MLLIGYCGALTIIAFALFSAYDFRRGGQTRKASPVGFGLLTAAAVMLTIYAVSLGDPVFTAANGVSILCDGYIWLGLLSVARKPQVQDVLIDPARIRALVDDAIQTH